jgi:hypothetical protein
LRITSLTSPTNFHGGREKERGIIRPHQVVSLGIPHATKERDVAEFFPNPSMISDNDRHVFIKQSF